ncbi:MAG: S8 family serine peptidase [Verrucomicrobia bacterium]|nr:S8 family serine peptidase [Verrucomicrobiota bacterium]
MNQAPDDSVTEATQEIQVPHKPAQALPLLASEQPLPRASSGLITVHAHPAATRAEVTLVQPADLPYPIRLEKFYRADSNGDEQLMETVEMVGNRLMARFSPVKLADGTVETALSAMGAELGRQLDTRGLHVVNFSPEDPATLPMLLASLSELSGQTIFAEPDYIVRILESPNDPRYLDGSLWGLRNTGQQGGMAGADVNAQSAWEVRSDAATVIVGIVDTGIRLTHEDLVANLWVNPNEISDGTDTDGNGFVDDIHGINAITMNGNPNDDHGHGTHCAGTVGAVGDNGIGVVGVAWNVQLMALKFMSSGGGGATSDAITCIQYGIDNGAHILSNSWGGTFFSQALYDSLKDALEAGVIIVAASGNFTSNNDITSIFPASLPLDNIVSVASTTRTDALSNFSNFGQGSVEIAAPGSDILSTGFESDSSYVIKSGTSMAAPHVAGAFGIVKRRVSGRYLVSAY